MIQSIMDGLKKKNLTPMMKLLKVDSEGDEYLFETDGAVTKI